MSKRFAFISAIWIMVLLFWVLPASAEMIVDTAWVRRYTGPGDYSDAARAIAVDSCGNVYVTGERWNGTNYDYATIRYYPNGDTAWVRLYNGPGNGDDGAWAIVVFGCDNIYVTGRSWGNGTNFDYATLKYDSSGNEAWVRRYNGPGNGWDEARAIAVDSSGNVYVTGWSYGSGTDDDYTTIKYYPDGDTAWVRRYNGLGSSMDDAYAITVDDSGNVYVTGDRLGGVTGYDYLTVKYATNGNELWVRSYNGSENEGDFANAIAVDGSGNVYVTGWSYDSTSDYDYATIKYYPDGDSAWVRKYNGPGNGEDIAGFILLDGSNNVYVAGYSWNGTNYDYATIKYDTSGNELWVKRYDGPTGNHDIAWGMAVNGSGNVYVTGFSWSSGTNYDYTTIRYDTDGNELWVQGYNGSGNSEDNAYAIIVDDSSNVYVTGRSMGSETSYDYVTIKYFQALRGDVNRDGAIDIADVVYLINYLFVHGPVPIPILRVGDVTCDKIIDVADVVYLINYLFIGGPSPDC
jgi:uncharacterized delta-60 repeat protein